MWNVIACAKNIIRPLKFSRSWTIKQQVTLKMTKEQKIVIIGAGAAGVAAASRLIENGFHNITILEAENRIGGRILSQDIDGKKVDLGAQWCHGEQENVVFNMVKDLNLLDTSFNNYTDFTYYSSNGELINKLNTEKLRAIANDIFYDIDKFKNNYEAFGDYFNKRYKEKVIQIFGNDKSMEDLAKQLSDWCHKFLLCYEPARSWYDFSCNSMLKYEDCDGDLQLNWKDKGYETIFPLLMKKIPDPSKEIPVEDKIKLNKEVTKITWDNNEINKNGATIKCLDGSTYNADHVIITISVGVLKNAYETLFVPELPAFKINAIKGISLGTVTKILLKFETKWWSDEVKGFSFLWKDNDRLNLLNEFNEGPIIDGKSWLEDVYGFYVIDSHPKILLGWMVGKMAGEVELLSDEILQSGCMYLLKRFLGDKYDIPQPETVLTSKWKTNPHFCGTYSFYGFEAEKRNTSFEDLAKPVISDNNKPTLLFAGEATHSKYYSTVHGAIETGYREADRIIDLYQKRKTIHKKVAIIGAGIAGLAAAKTFLDNGFKNIIILEAQDRPGGRIQTVKLGNNDGILELGAQFIHGKSNKLCELAKKHNLLSEEVSEEGLGMYIREDGFIFDDFLVKKVDFEIGKILTKCEKFVKMNDFPRSVEDFLEREFYKNLQKSDDNSTELKELKLQLFDWHKRFQIIDNSCENLNKLSAKAWGKYICVDDQAHNNLKNGYKSLIDILVNNCKDVLLLNTPVLRINYENEIIKIVCKNNLKITAEHCILTPSLGVLKKFVNNIYPPLPQSITESIKRLGFYGIGKIFLIYEYKWWDFDGIQFIWKDKYINEKNQKWTKSISGFDLVLNQSNVLLGWVGGKVVEEMERLSEDEIKTDCTNLLKKFLGAKYDIPEPLQVIRTKWISNAWIQGSYCHITPDCDYTDYGIHKLSEPVYKDGIPRILLAGEAVSHSHYSTTHGAYESGEIQAKFLCNYLSNNIT